MTFSGSLRLARMNVVHDDDAFAADDEPALSGVLVVSGPALTHAVHCPDLAALLTAFKRGRPYAARGFVLRSVPEQGSVRLTASWTTGTAVLSVLPAAGWGLLLAALATQVCGALAEAGEQEQAAALFAQL